MGILSGDLMENGDIGKKYRHRLCHGFDHAESETFMQGSLDKKVVPWQSLTDIIDLTHKPNLKLVPVYVSLDHCTQSPFTIYVQFNGKVFQKVKDLEQVGIILCFFQATDSQQL